MPGNRESAAREAAAVGAALAALRRVRVACLGDVMLDVDVACGAGRLSPEAPVLVFQEGPHRARPGGAANVAMNIAALGAEVCLAGLIGMDEAGTRLAALLGEGGVETRLLRAGHGHPTTTKTRYVADGQQLLRIDRERAEPLGPALAAELVAGLAAGAGRIDAVVLSDYGKGVVVPPLIEACHALARRHRIPVLVDPKGIHWQAYGPVDLIKPNAGELAAFTALPCTSDDEVAAALRAALERCAASALVVTRAERGAAYLCRETGAVGYVPAEAVEVADVCGAGDTNLATLASLLAAGTPLADAIALAQRASAIAVQRHGTAVVSALDLLAAGDAHRHPAAEDKVLTLPWLLELVGQWRDQGLRIGFTNGCFDLFHPGHVRALEQARACCDRLVVGLNADASVRRLKGPARPVLGEADRALVLAAQASVDAVALFGEDTPETLIAALRPDVLVKGGDYDPDHVAGGALVRSYGGRVVVTDLVPARSTSSIIAAINDRD